MSRIPPIMSLHLRYRLWIAEMNSDINVLRIFEDYLKELESKKNGQEVRTRIDYFQKQFINLRKEIDELRHEMHIIKMKLAAYSRESKPLSYKIYQADNHTALKKHYFGFRKIFDQIKNEFRHFEG